MAVDGDGPPFQARHEWSSEAISIESHARANRNGLTPLVPGASEGDGRRCTSAASISFGVCASRSGSAWITQAACKAVNSDRYFIICERAGTDEAIFTIVQIEWYIRRQSPSKLEAEKSKKTSRRRLYILAEWTLRRPMCCTLHLGQHAVVILENQDRV